MDPERARRAEERRLRREREQAAKLTGQAPPEEEKRIPIDIVYQKLTAVTSALRDGVLIDDLWVLDGSRYVRIPIGSSVTLHPEVDPTAIIVSDTEKVIKDKLCKKEQGRVFAQSGAWIDSEGAERAAERMKQSEEIAADFRAQAGTGPFAGLPEFSSEPYYELRNWSGTLWPYCLLCNKFADFDHVASDKHLKRVPYWLDYLPQEHKMRILQKPTASSQALSSAPVASAMPANPSPALPTNLSVPGFAGAPMLHAPSVAVPSAYPPAFEPQYEAHAAPLHQPSSSLQQRGWEEKEPREREEHDEKERGSTQEELRGSRNGDWHQQGWVQREWSDRRKDDSAGSTGDTSSINNDWSDWHGKAAWNSSIPRERNDASDWAGWSSYENSWGRPAAKETGERDTWASWENDWKW